MVDRFVEIIVFFTVSSFIIIFVFFFIITLYYCSYVHQENNRMEAVTLTGTDLPRSSLTGKGLPPPIQAVAQLLSEETLKLPFKHKNRSGTSVADVETSVQNHFRLSHPMRDIFQPRTCSSSQDVPSGPSHCALFLTSPA